MRLVVWGTGLLAARFMDTVKEEVIGFVSKDEPSEQFKKIYVYFRRGEYDFGVWQKILEK